MRKKAILILTLCCILLVSCGKQSIVNENVDEAVALSIPKIEAEEDSNSSDIILKKDNNEALPYLEVLNKIVEENNYSSYADLKIYNLKDNVFLIGFGLDRYYAYNRHWYITDTYEQSYKKIEGNYSNFYSFDNNVVLAYNDGDLSKTTCFFHDFPYFWSYDLETGISKKESYFANMNDWESFQIGGTGQNYVVEDIQKEENKYILHLKSKDSILGSPKGTITSTDQKIIISFTGVKISEVIGINKISDVNISQHTIDDIENSYITIHTDNASKYNCKISNIDNLYYTFTITTE